MTEAERKAAFASNRMAESFLAVMLEDAGHYEQDCACMEEREQRDTGTIYDCPDATFLYALTTCKSFADKLEVSSDKFPDFNPSSHEAQLGSDLYLHMYGHGVDFRDRNTWAEDHDECADIGNWLSSIADELGAVETYLDDRGVWVFGHEA